MLMETNKKMFNKLEEYDFHPEYFESGEWLDILDLAEQAYLQGAKDMREAVKIKDINRNYSDSCQAGFNIAVKELDSKAQQFIDSLEGKE